MVKKKRAENRESRDGPRFREGSFDSLARRTVITVDPSAAELPFVTRYASFILIILISIQLDNV